MFSFFSWLRNRVRDSVLAGLEDAAAEIDAGDETRPALEAFRNRLRALPAPEPEPEAETSNGRRVKSR